MTTRHKSEDTVTNRRNPSVAIFGDLANLLEQASQGKCIVYDNDFGFGPTLASVTAQGEYYSYQDTGVTITTKAINDPDVELGVLQIAGNDADNDEGHVQFGLTNQWSIDNAAGNNQRIGYEVRFRSELMAANETAFAIGLVGGPVAADHLDDNTGEIKDSTSFLGFRALAATPTDLDFVYQSSGATAVVTAGDSVATLVEDTYVRVGFLYEPNAPASSKIRAYVNGTLVAKVSLTNIDAATFPEAEAMVPAIMTKVGTAALSGNFEVDRVTFAVWQADR